jgi:hopene-associated glycosyltransferase HpnB
MILLVSLAALGWIGLLIVPWKPWSTQEQLEATPERADLSDVSVLIPARNEADVIATTIRSLEEQGHGLKVILIDDCSSDGTAEKARSPLITSFEVIKGKPLPEGWAGKLWALEQGRDRVQSDLILLLDADIALKPGTILALKKKLTAEGLGLVSLMAELRMQGFWEKLLIPAFIYYFKLVYPFALAGDPKSKLGAAAGGCILLKREALDRIGGFAALRDAIIDDCSLARKIKAAGYPIWLGLTHSAVSLRPYSTLGSLWNMVARSAFTQLRYSIGLLWLTTAALLFFYWVPLAGLFSTHLPIQIISATGLAAMMLSFVPTLKYYGRSWAWALLLPGIGTLYLLMTWTSAIRFWRGKRAEWKGRVYAATSRRSSPHQSETKFR